MIYSQIVLTFDATVVWVNQTQVTEWEKQLFVMFDIHMAQLSVCLVTTP
jgi:hypothetical protein